MKQFKRILIIRTDRIGDVILSTPVIENLRNSYPEAHIAFMARPYTKDIIEKNPYLNEIILYDKDDKNKSVFSSLTFCLALRKKKFDIAFILNPTNRANLITFFAGIPMRVGLNRKMGRLLTHRIEDRKHEGKKHEMEYTLDIIKEIGIEAFKKKTYFPLSGFSEQRIKNLLKEHGINDYNFIVICPWASCPSKRWPGDYFTKLISLLKEKTPFKIVIINEHKQAIPGLFANDVLDLSESLSLSDLGSLFKRAKLFISNDSGPVHIAASLNCSVISIFGRNQPGLSPMRWRPLNEKSFYIHKGCDSKECLAHNCVKNFACLSAITPEEVLNLALSTISRSVV